MRVSRREGCPESLPYLSHIPPIHNTLNLILLNIPCLGMKCSQVGNKTFPNWEKIPNLCFYNNLYWRRVYRGKKGEIREGYGRDSKHPSRLAVPVFKGLPIKNGRDDGFFCNTYSTKVVMLRGGNVVWPSVEPTGLRVSPETSDVRYICHCLRPSERRRLKSC